MESFTEAWGLICNYCKTKGNIPDIAYNSWISRIEPVDLDVSSGTVTLKVPTVFHRDIIMKSYEKLFHEAFLATLGSDFDIQFLTEDHAPPKEQPEKKVKRDDYDFTFDTFIVGPSNKFAHAAFHGSGHQTGDPV